MKVDKTKWKKAPLSEITHIIMGQSPDSSSYNKKAIGLPFYQGNADFGKIHPIPRIYCNAPIRIAKENTLLISVRAPIGAINITNELCCIGRGLAAIQMIDKKSHLHFIKYVLKAANNELNSKGTGMTFKAINKKVLFNHIVFLPEFDIQQAIASELDAIQTMIDGYKAQLEDLDALAQSIFLDMFGDPVSNPKGWEKKELRELGVISSGGTPLRSNPLYYKGDIDWYSAGELNHLYLNGSNEKITKEAIKESSAKLFKANSLFIGLYDTAAFKLGITLKEASANQACANLFPIKDNVIWIYYCLLNMKEYAWNFRKGIRQKNLSVGFIKSFSVPLPPLSLQQQFANQVEAIEKQKDLLREQLKDAETLMAERMQYYFS